MASEAGPRCIGLGYCDVDRPMSPVRSMCLPPTVGLRWRSDDVVRGTMVTCDVCTLCVKSCEREVTRATNVACAHSPRTPTSHMSAEPFWFASHDLSPTTFLRGTSSCWTQQEHCTRVERGWHSIAVTMVAQCLASEISPTRKSQRSMKLGAISPTMWLKRTMVTVRKYVVRIVQCKSQSSTCWCWSTWKRTQCGHF